MASKKRSVFDDGDDDDESANQPSRNVIQNLETSQSSPLPSKSMKTKPSLSPSQRARIEQNRQRALLIRNEKINRQLRYGGGCSREEISGPKIIRVNDTKLIDTGAGFFMEEETPNKKPEIPVVKLDTPLYAADDRPTCEECQLTFNDSFLMNHFDLLVCDQCRDNDDRHTLITKTDASNEYLLKDLDFDLREPPLKFIVRKNPHNSRWGDMKLYLKLQVEKRALEVWGSEEALEEALQKKTEQRELNKQKKFKKKMNELRMNVRSSVYTHAQQGHVHEFGDEMYNDNDDEYTKTCRSCGYVIHFEKL